MDVNTALKNFNFLKDLKPFRKLTIIYENETKQSVLCYDDRWIQSVRRKATGDSRNNLLTIVEQTFDTLCHTNPLNSEEEQNVLRHLSITLKKTYSSFSHMHGENGLIDKLMKRSLDYEVQRKAQELLLEKSFPDRTTIFEPVVSSPPLLPQLPSQKTEEKKEKTEDKKSDYIFNANTKHVTSLNNSHDIYYDENSESEQVEKGKCCGCITFKSKSK